MLGTYAFFSATILNIRMGSSFRKSGSCQLIIVWSLSVEHTLDKAATHTWPLVSVECFFGK